MVSEGKKYWPITNGDVYVKVFNEILSEIDHELVDPGMVSGYRRLSLESQYLITRLYIRKHKWVRTSDLESYLPLKTLQENVIPELIQTNWVLDTPPVTKIITDVASQKELQATAKSLGLKILSSNRSALAEKLVQLEKQQHSFRLSTTTTKISDSLQISCCKLSDPARSFLFQLEQMFLYPIGPDATLETIYLTHMKKLAFLNYTYQPQKEAPIFSSRESFLAFANARKICIDIEEAISLPAQRIPESVMSEDTLTQLETGLMDAKSNNHTQALRVYGRGMFNISQVFMKVHRFREEYSWIQKYLNLSDHRGKRGVSLIRKLLLEIRFLQETGTVGDNSWLMSAVNTYYDALSEVSEIERLDLERKTTKLLTSIRNTGLKSALSVIISASQPDLIKFKFPTNEVIAVPVRQDKASVQDKEVSIRLPPPEPTTNTPGTRLTYADGFDVERTAMIQYKDFKGGHYENSMMLTILWLLVHDVVFSDPTQFRCAYQSYPMNIQKALDDKKIIILERLANVKHYALMNRKTLDMKYPNEPKPYVGSINWSISEENLTAVLDGLGNEKTKLILQRIISDYFKFSSGFPDLTLWLSEGTHTKFVEVKSENDTLSDNQILWMRFLLDIGVDAEICKVIPTKKAPKRKRKS